MRNSVPVHNRIGIVFTGIIELLVSTITSLSVCALVGFKVTMIPWYVYILPCLNSIIMKPFSRELFPLVILFVGAENMYSLVRYFYYLRHIIS